MAEKVWGCKPIILSLPYLSSLASSDRAGFTVIIATCNPAMANAFSNRGTFWLNQVPPRNANVDGFAIKPEAMPHDERTLAQNRSHRAAA
jgi:hypothetical protein